MPNQLIPSALDRRSFLRIGGVGAGAVGSTALLAACSGTSGASPSGSSGGGSKSFDPISVQLSWIKNIEFAGEYFAEENGYYTKAGFPSVTLLAGGTSTTAEEILISGKALVGLSAPIATVPSVLKGAPLKIIASTYQKNPFCLMSLSDKGHTPIRTIADLKGKKLGVQTGANQTIVKGFLKANGLTTSDVTIVTTGFDIAPLVSGKYDAHMSYITNEPILAASEGHTPVILGFADNGLPFVAETYTVLQDTIAQKRDLLKAFLKAEIQGWTDAVKDPAKSADLATNKYGKGANFGKDLDAGEQTKEATAQNGLILTDDVNTNGLFTMTQSLIDENIKSLAAMGYTITADKLFDLSLLQEVYKENPSLKTSFTIPAAG